MPDLRGGARTSWSREALAEGGIDNITVIVADVVDADGTTDQVVISGAAAEREIPTVGQRGRDAPDRRPATRTTVDDQLVPGAADASPDDGRRRGPLHPAGAAPAAGSSGR